MDQTEYGLVDLNPDEVVQMSIEQVDTIVERKNPMKKFKTPRPEANIEG